MADKGFKRKLAAILSADVEGYSRLMDDDEEATVRTLTAYRNATNDLVQQYRGRTVDTPGDNILAEFTSVVDAVNCAVEIQRELAERNAELPENRRMQFRIGVNLGDVIEEKGRIYGDGVNIAARMEAMAEAGGICVSGRAYDQVENKLGLEYENLGEHQVKNITRPIRVFRVLSFPGAAAHRVVQAKKTLGKKWRRIALATSAMCVVGIVALAVWNFFLRPSPPLEPASVKKMAFPLPDKPSIAVLPFNNLSGDPDQEYFCDGMTEEIITALSKSARLFVIARNSVFTYKGKPVKVQQVSEDLGVRYVLEGSVRKAGDRVRITAQLIDATLGNHVWSERYDRKSENIFAIQDDITLEIMRAMHVKLLGGEQVRHWHKHGTRNLQAYEKLLQTRSYSINLGTKEALTRMRQLYEEAVALDPGYARAYAELGWNHFLEARFGWSESPAESIKIAFEYGEKAVELDDTLDWSHMLLASIYLVKRQFEKAVAEAERAVALNPSGADAYTCLSGIIGCSGRWEESVVFGEKSIRLNPNPTVYYYHWLGRAYFMTERYDEAIDTWKKALNLSPDYLNAHAFLAACYSSVNRQAEAAAAAKEVLRINPKFSIESYAKRLPYKNKADIERYVAALRKAGLK
jgi:TolB-like protein/class 3 adenylate cyclase